MGLKDRLAHSWDAFKNNKDPTPVTSDEGYGYYYRPDRVRLSRGNEKSITTSIYNRIALDVASVEIKHVQLDSDGRMTDIINSDLNECLTIESNVDQTPRALMQDAVLSMFDNGSVAIVPTITDLNPNLTDSYDIKALRIGKIIEWKSQHVKINVYNELAGKKQDIWMPKKAVAIIQNPMYAVINEPNSTMKRLVNKLNLLDIIDEQSGSGKLDLIIQLPYTIKSEARRQQAEKRTKDIEMQLSRSKFGIAYTDGTEHITQLNRSVENKLMSQIEYLTKLLYSQIGVTESVMDGTADEKTMLNYNNRTVEPIVSAIVDEMKRKFLTKTARTQGKSIKFFKDPFKLVPVASMADIADKFTRNEIMSTNEIRQIIGMKPSKDPKADELRNKNLNQPDEKIQAEQEQHVPDEKEE